MFALALGGFRHRLGGFVATFLVLFTGAAIVMVCGGIVQTAIQLRVAPERLAAASVVLVEDQSSPAGEALPERAHLDSSALERVRAVPGVGRAVPELSVPIALDRGSGQLDAADGWNWSSSALTPYTLTAGRAPASDGDVVVSDAIASPLRLTVGSTIALVVSGESRSFTVSGIANTRRSTAPAVFFSDAEAAGLSGHPGRLDAIGVLPGGQADPSTLSARLTRAFAGTDVQVLTGDARSRAEFPTLVAAGDDLIPLGAVFGGLSIILTIVIVSGTLSLAIRQRARELALLRAVGMTPANVRRMMVLEALAVGVPAVALAWLPSTVVGGWVVARLADGGMVPAGLVFGGGIIPAVCGAGAALGAAIGAALIAANGVARSRPVEALGDAEVRRRWLTPLRGFLALGAFGGAAALSIVSAVVLKGPIASSTATPSALLWAAGFALVAPALGRAIAWAAGVVLGHGAAGHLAVRNAARRPVELGAAIIPVMLVVGLACSFVLLQQNGSTATTQAEQATLRANTTLVSSTGIAPTAVEELSGMPGVQAASPLIESTLYSEWKDDGEVEDQEIPVLGVSTAAVADVLDIHVGSGSLDALRGETIALPRAMTATPGMHIGEIATLRMGDGRNLRLRVVAALDARPGFEQALMPAAALLPHTTTGLVHTVLASVDPAGASSVNAFITAHPGTTPPPAEQAGIPTGTEAWIDYLLVALIVGYSIISLLNTSVISIGARRREFALLRLLGLSRASVIRMVTIEALLTALAGIVLGLAVLLAVVVPFNLGLSDDPFLGFHGGVLLFGAVACATGLVTVLTMWTVSLFSTRQRPVDALAD